jgi:fatty-acyl-CoA synthase
MGAREICIGYGQTEASPLITLTCADDQIEVRVGTVGQPIPGLEVKLVNAVSGEESPPNEAGELCVRGHCVMPGYYNNADATARAIDSAGWLHTGDLASRRDDGNYRIVGRSKEMIIRGGENVYPAEIEEFLHRHPCIAEVAVVGVPDAKYGEVVAAWVVPKAGSTITPDDVRCHCRDQIAYFKVPQYVTIVDHLPRTVTGKIRKHVLKEQAIGKLGLSEAARIETA